METSKEPISVRIARMNNMFLGKTPKKNLGREGLLDALIVLYDECNTDVMKKDPNVAAFVDKFRSYVSEMRSMRVNISDFELKKIIGRGHFGEVHLVREKQTGDIYAMKTLRKCDTLGNKRAFYEEERDIMANTASPWITSLQYAFQDMLNLYLVMEFLPGGDLLNLLERSGGSLPEDTARFYLAELVCAINSLHQMGYVHRDIKPDNILLDRCGHIKLADFGSSAKLTGAGVVLSQMPVGTPEYLAPEVLKSIEAMQGINQERATSSRSPPAHQIFSYGLECDYWSLGIVGYEMVLGRTPFSGDQLATTYQNIQLHKKKLEYPDNVDVSSDLKDLISGLLEDAKFRLTHDKITRHSFFAVVDWESLRDIVPPFVPIVNGEDDTSNFSEFERHQPGPSIENFKSHKGFSGRNLPFVGFTYAKDSGSGQASSSNDNLLEKKLGNKKREIHELLSKIHALEGNSGRKAQDSEALERRAEAAEQRLTLVEQDRSRLEAELARARSEQQSLRRALDLEMQETKNMEAKAMELIKGAKEKWDRLLAKEHREKDRKIEKLTDQLTTLNTANNSIMSKLHRSEKEKAQLQAEVSQLQELVKEYKENMAKARQNQRESIIDVQSRLSQMAAESQTELAELRSLYDSETKKFEQRMAQADKKQHDLLNQLELRKRENSELHSQLEAKNRELQMKTKSHVAALEKRVQEGCTNCAQMRERLATLENELSESMISFEKHEHTIAAKEMERDFELENALKEKVELEKQLQLSHDKEEENRSKLCSLEKLMQSLQSSIANLEEENSKLREQNMCLAKYKRQSSIGAAVMPASPRASTTTTVTTTTIVASQAEASIEPVCNGKEEYETPNLQLQVMEASIERLEAQLEKAKEASILDRQKANSAQTELWRKEKDLSNTKLDLRIAERELKTVTEQLKKSQEERKKLEEDLKKEKDLKKLETNKIVELTAELQELQSKLHQDKLSSSSLADVLASRNSDLASKELKLKELQADLAAATKQIRMLETQVHRTDETCLELRDEKKRALQQLEEAQRSVQRLEVNNNVLKDTCSMLEEQLEDFEKLTSSYEAKEARLREEYSKMKTDLEVAQGELRLAKQSINEEKSLRARSDSRIPSLESQLSESKEALSQAREQALEYKGLAERLTEQVNSLEERSSQLEVNLHATQRQVSNLQAELVSLKEECATQITRILTLKETNQRLDQELKESIEEERSLLERVERLQATIAEMEACHAHREVKSDATLQQQAKLIAYLQHKLEEQGRRKKTLTDKLFGKRDKENQMNSVNIINAGMKELEAQLQQERNKVMKLTEQIVRASTRGHKSSAQEKHEKEPPSSPVREPLSPNTAKHLVLSPGSQATPGSFRRQTSLQRMHHNIPHRFEMKLIMRASKCSACQDGVPFGRQAAQCQECGAVAHHRCTSLVPSTCGLPSGFARHFSQRWKKSKEEGVSEGKTTAPTTSTVDIEGWMKLPTRGNTCWERRYVKLAGNELLVFAHEPCAGASSAQMSPLERIPICSPDGVTTVSSVSHAEIASTAKSDIPFIIKLEVSPRTTCWPASNQYFMALTATDKERWLEALKAAIKASENLQGHDVPAVDRSRRYSGQVVARLPQESKMDISCVLHLTNEVILIGAEEGLFSYRIRKEKSTPVKISGIGPVYQMAVMRHIGLVIMIAGKTRELLCCDVGSLKICAEAAACAQPTLTTRMVLPATEGSSTSEASFQILSVSKLKDAPNTQDILCAASAKRIVILRFNSSDNTFQPLKSLQTQEPCSSILLTLHSIIVGCNKFYEIDAQDFTVNDFLDESDKSLAHVTINMKKTNNYPIAILDVTMPGCKCSPEYLVCFHMIGVFVDQYGRRSREEDLQWAHVPFAFAFRKPFLFVFHFASVEVLRVTPSSFMRGLDESSSTSSEVQPSTVIELNNPQYLGDTDVAGGIYACNIPARGVEIVRIDGSLACPDPLGYSCSSVDTATGNRDGDILVDDRDASEFSFTSSIMHSLEEDSDEERESATDDACSSSLPESSSADTESRRAYSRHVRFGTGSTPHTAL